LEITVHYGFENQIVARHYRILKVEAVVRLAKMEQPLLLDDSDKREAR
jgi:hypothetical protein